MFYPDFKNVCIPYADLCQYVQEKYHLCTNLSVLYVIWDLPPSHPQNSPKLKFFSNLKPRQTKVKFFLFIYLHSNVVRILQKFAPTTNFIFFLACWNFGFIFQLQRPLDLFQELIPKYVFSKKDAYVHLGELCSMSGDWVI